MKGIVRRGGESRKEERRQEQEDTLVTGKKSEAKRKPSDGGEKGEVWPGVEWNFTEISNILQLFHALQCFEERYRDSIGNVNKGRRNRTI